MDIKLGEGFDVQFSGRNDLETITGREAFEQRVAIRAVGYFHEVIGRNLPKEQILNLIQLEAQRVASDGEYLNDIKSISAQFSPDSVNTVQLTIVYNTNEQFQIDLTE
ncbi:hypothetical protein [Halocatena halophila]|uniref:hypothetical protein n=1 Tax=Halocatena halophila TaxID=2814576 RepID=UPI002ED013FE